MNKIWKNSNQIFERLLHSLPSPPTSNPGIGGKVMVQYWQPASAKRGALSTQPAAEKAPVSKYWAATADARRHIGSLKKTANTVIYQTPKPVRLQSNLKFVNWTLYILLYMYEYIYYNYMCIILVVSDLFSSWALCVDMLCLLLYNTAGFILTPNWALGAM